MGYSIDVYDHDFEQEVLEKSYETPVIVDFFATWCGPCQMLKPMLEKVAKEYDCVVAKVDIDQNPYLSQALKIEGVPDVKIIYQGQLINGFVGVLPEPQLQELLAKCNIKRMVDDELSAIASGNFTKDGEASPEMWQKLLEKYPNNPQITLDAAKYFISINQIESAQELLANLPLNNPEFVPVGKAIAALIQFQIAAIDAGETDLDRSFAQAASFTIAGNYKAALDLFLAVVETDRKYQDDGARKAILSIFDILGNSDPLTLEYRQKLTLALF